MRPLWPDDDSWTEETATLVAERMVMALAEIGVATTPRRQPCGLNYTFPGVKEADLERARVVVLGPMGITFVDEPMPRRCTCERCMANAEAAS